MSIPMAAQVALPGLQVTRYAYSCPGIPMAAQVALPGLQVTRYSYSCPGVPMAAQVPFPGLQVTRYSHSLLPIKCFSTHPWMLCFAWPLLYQTHIQGGQTCSFRVRFFESFSEVGCRPPFLALFGTFCGVSASVFEFFGLRFRMTFVSVFWHHMCLRVAFARGRGGQPPWRYLGSPSCPFAAISDIVSIVFVWCGLGRSFGWVVAQFGVFVGVMLAIVFSSLDVVFCMAPAVPNPHSGRPDLLISGTFL